LPLPVGKWRFALSGFAAWYVWALITPAIESLADRWRMQRPIDARAIAIHAVAAVAACGAQAAIATLTTFWIAPNPGAPLPQVFASWYLVLLPAGVVVYAAVVGVRTAHLHRAESLARARAAEQLAAELGKAQLSALRAQLQPHFLFNTLNAVIALVRAHENDDAVEALLMLSDLLRATLHTGAQPEVPLEDELLFAQHYLAIERLRFGDRLTVQVDSAEELRRAMVPTFFLQPLIENAIKHGMRDRTDGGRIAISLSRSNRHLGVRIEDNGPGLSQDWEARCAAGYGLSNARARLSKLYGDDASLTIGRRDRGGGTVVDVTLPLRMSDAAPQLADIAR
jgi:signal transduction histidine kinase